MPSQLRNNTPAEVILSAASTIGSPDRFYYRQNERKNKQGQMELVVTPPPAFFFSFTSREHPSLQPGRSWNTSSARLIHDAACLV